MVKGLLVSRKMLRGRSVVCDGATFCPAVGGDSARRGGGANAGCADHAPLPNNGAPPGSPRRGAGFIEGWAQIPVTTGGTFRHNHKPKE